MGIGDSACSTSEMIGTLVVFYYAWVFVLVFGGVAGIAFRELKATCTCAKTIHIKRRVLSHAVEAARTVLFDLPQRRFLPAKDFSFLVD